MLAAATPFVLPRLPQLIPLFDNSKLAAPALKAAAAIVEQIAPQGHSVADRVMPPLLAGIEDKKWKVKAGCIQVLLPALKQMEGTTMLQLANCLPAIVSKLAEAALEVRAEIRNATGAVLKEIGAFVGSPEIKALSQDLVTALAEPTNQKHTQAVLAKMGNATFKSMIDEASLALLLPIVVRGLKDREAMSKKWSAQIFGSIALLVRDVDFLKPYLKTALPLLQAALNDSVPEVRREAAKAYGLLEQVMPEYSRTHCQPFLFGKLRGGDASEQIGAALGLAEVFVRMDKAKLSQFVPEVQKGANDENLTVRRGFLELMDTMPQAMKMDFVPYIERLFPAMLMGINGEKDLSDDAALKAAQALVGRFGDLCPDLLMSAFEGAYAKALQPCKDWKQMQVVREKSMQLLLKTAEKILEHKKFGQDLLTCDECSNKATRLRILILAFVGRNDPDAAVKRVASNVWKTSGGSPKMQKTIVQELSQSFMKWRAGSMGPGLQKVAKDALAELVKAGDLEEVSEEVEATTNEFVFDVAKSINEEAAQIASGSFSVSEADEADTKEDCQMVKKVEAFWNKHATFGTLLGELKTHILSVSESIIREGHKKKLPGSKVVEELQLALQQICQCCKEQVEDFLKSLPENAVRIVRLEQAAFSLLNLTWIWGAFFGAIVGFGRAYMPEDAVFNMNVWVKELHGPNGSAPCGPWVLGLVILSLLTAFGGASVGPEPVVIIMPSVVYVALVKRVLNPSVHVLRIAALAGGAGGLAAFFGLPLASAFFAIEIPHMDGAEFALEAYSACVVAGVGAEIFPDCQPVKLPYLYEKLIYKDAIVAHPGVSMSGWEMFGLGLVKLVMISILECDTWPRGSDDSSPFSQQRLTRNYVAPYFQLVSQQKPRQDLQYIERVRTATEVVGTLSQTTGSDGSEVEPKSTKGSRTRRDQGLVDAAANDFTTSLFTSDLS
eukprot:symbB.v1.2.018050.t3/scaffold1425.1/size119490/8